MAKSADTTATFLQLNDSLGKSGFAPVYLLHGEEGWFIDALTDKLEATVLTDAERSFNQTILYGRDVKVNDLLSTVRRFPMMSNYQLVVVREAQDMKDWDKMLSYFEQPLPSTVLVIAWKNGKMDSRTKTFKAISKFQVYHAEKLRDYQIKSWIPQFCRMKGRSIDQAAADMLVDLLGADLPAVHNELEKIFVTVKDEFIRTGHVEANVGFNREYNVFELQNALGQRDFNRSVQIAHQMAHRAERGEIHRIVPVLFGFFSKVVSMHYLGSAPDNVVAGELGVNPYFVKDYRTAARLYPLRDLEHAIGQIKYLDLRLKGVHRGNAEDGDLLIETVVSILRN